MQLAQGAVDLPDFKLDRFFIAIVFAIPDFLKQILVAPFDELERAFDSVRAKSTRWHNVLLSVCFSVPLLLCHRNYFFDMKKRFFCYHCKNNLKNKGFFVKKCCRVMTTKLDLEAFGLFPERIKHEAI